MVSTTVRPRVARFLITLHASRLADGSNPVVGSSRKSSSGSATRAMATSRRRCCTSRELRHPGVGLLLEAHHPDHVVDRTGVRVERRVHRDRLADGEITIDAGGLERDPDAALELRALTTRVDTEDADVAAIAAAVSLEVSTVVVFPAPLGPSSAKTSPRRIERSMPLTA